MARRVEAIAWRHHVDVNLVLLHCIELGLQLDPDGSLLTATLNRKEPQP